MTKHSKKEVSYGPGHVQSHCGPVFHDDTHHCVHFKKSDPSYHSGSCTEVSGVIDPANWCELWRRVSQ